MIVNFKRSGVFNADGVILKPGNNPVDIKKWEKSRKHPMVAHLIEEGEIIEESEFKEGTSKKDDEAADETILGSMKIPDAKRMVEETVDMGLLERWKKGETRNQIKGAINAQLEKLKAEPEERDRTQSRQVEAGVSVKETFVQNPEDKE